MANKDSDSPRESQRVTTATRGPSMFQSARFKLTLFYLAGVLVFSLTLSFTTLRIAQREYEHSNVAQRGEFRGVITRIYGIPIIRADDKMFNFQTEQERAVRTRLNEYLILINSMILIIGGFASYWFAGRTLKPIEEAHEAQKRFASDASHELRTPLTAIRAENEVFLRQKDFDKTEARELIQSNLEEVDRLERLATNLLSLTQYESAVLDLAETDIQSVVDEAIKQTVRVHAGNSIANRVPAGKVLCHGESLVQLLTIVLDNACKYGQEKPIKITGKLFDGRYEIYVRDHGAGIPPTDLPYIFDRLYRGDRARSNAVAGHGLGLALARQIARANNATITAANHPKGGSVFTIMLARF